MRCYELGGLGTRTHLFSAGKCGGSRVTEREKGGKCILYIHVNEGEKSGLS